MIPTSPHSKPRFRFLLIDDEKDQMTAFIDRAKQKMIQVKAMDNVEDGLVELRAYPDLYHAVILDAKCKLRKEDTAERYNESALRTALKNLDDLQKSIHSKIPRCIFTGHSDAYANNELTEKVFMKGQSGSDEALLDFLVAEVHANPINTIQWLYADVLRIFSEGYLNQTKRSDFIQLLLNMDTVQSTEVQQYMQLVRKFIEDMYLRMNSLDPAWMPTVLIPNNRPNLLWCSIYMSGKEVKHPATKAKLADGLIDVPGHIAATLEYLTKMTNTASHSGSVKPTNHALKSLVFGLNEVLLWFKQEVDLKYFHQLAK